MIPSILSFICKTIINYIIGNGLIDKNNKINPHSFLSKQDLRMLVTDFKVTGSAFPQIINFQNKVVKIKHTPVMRVGLNIDIDKKSNTFMEVNGYWYSWDFSRPYEFNPSFVPKFDANSKVETYEIQHIKQLSSEPYFPFPDWFSGLKSAKIESALIDDAVNHVLRGFQGKTIININNGDMMDEDEKLKLKNEIKKNWTGTENSDGVTVSVNESADQAIVVDTIEPRGRNDQFVTYDETAEIKLMAAHGAMNILFSRPGSNGFSNNADEIATATDSLYLGIINPMREIILDSLNQIFKKIDPLCDIDFVNFGQEKAIVSDIKETDSKKLTEFTLQEFYNENRDENGRFSDGDSGGGEKTDEQKAYNPPNIKTEADNLKLGEKINTDKYKNIADNPNKGVTPTLALALDISNGATIKTNFGQEWTAETMGTGSATNSLYFEKNGIEYRISNHELPERKFMEAHKYKNVDEAIKKGISTKKLFHKNNVEIIVKDGKVAKINKNFNY